MRMVWICVIFAALLCTTYSRELFKSPPVCKTWECKNLGIYYLGNMDQNEKPCRDFYNYVCHNWSQNNPKPNDFALWSIQTMIDRRIDSELKKILEDHKVSLNPVIEKAKAVYKICLNSASLERKDPNSIKHIMSQIPAWPLLYPTNKKLAVEQVWKIDNEYSKITGESALFDITVDMMPKVDEFVAYVGVMPTPYGMLLRTSAWKKKTEWPNYKLFLKRLIYAVAPNTSALSDNVLDKDLDRVIEFREQIEKVIIQTQTFDTCGRLTIKNFQEWYTRHLKTGNVQIHWLQVLHSFYNNPNDPRREQFPTTIAFFIEEMKKLIEILDNTPKRVIVNHIHLYFLEKHLRFSPQMKINLKESVSYGDKNTGQILYDTEKWIRCIALYNLRSILSREYHLKYFNTKIETAIEKLIDELKINLENQILGSNWLDVETRLKSISKLHRISAAVGVPDWYRCSLKEPQDTDQFSLKVEAHYKPRKNHIYISAAYLKWPFYTPNVPYVIDYGATATTIGHELYHAFDLSEVTADWVRKDEMWPQKMKELYGKQSKCFLNHYIKYKGNELKKHNINRANYTMEHLDEDIADAMGLKVAYLAYREAFKKNKGVCPILPGFENFGCEKLFFIAFANTHCTTSTTGETEKSLIHDVHNLHKIRVNGGVANMKEFNNVFGCTTNDPLRFEKSCDIWKQ